MRYLPIAVLIATSKMILNDLASQIGTELILDQLDNDDVNTKDGQDTNQFAHIDQSTICQYGHQFNHI